MPNKLAQALSLISAQSEQIARLAQLQEMHFATTEALSTLLQSTLPYLFNEPEFAQLLTKVHEVRLARHLQKDVSNIFIEKYLEVVNAFLPPELKFSPPSFH